MENKNDDPNNSPIHSFTMNTPQNSMSTSKLITILVGCVIFGVVTGTLLAVGRNSLLKSPAKNSIQIGGTTKTVEGITDKKTFKDSASGILREGGFEGEGSYHLERPGGDSQNVYLTSSAVDLSTYVGKKVTVWGETFQAEKAGWLMDVGMVENAK